MYRTAVLALDLSPAAEPLLECAAELRRWGVDQLVITHVVRIGYGQEPGERALQDIREWLEGRAARLRGPALRVEVMVQAAGSPSEGIFETSDEAKADLIVLGSRSHNLASRLFLGSVARDMVRKTTLPLLLEWLEPVSHGAVPGCAAVCVDTLRHVVLATDLSKHAGAAEDAAMCIGSPGTAGRLPGRADTGGRRRHACTTADGPRGARRSARTHRCGGRPRRGLGAGRRPARADCSRGAGARLFTHRLRQAWPALGAEHGDRQYRIAPLRDGGAAGSAGAVAAGTMNAHR